MHSQIRYIYADLQEVQYDRYCVQILASDKRFSLDKFHINNFKLKF